MEGLSSTGLPRLVFKNVVKKVSALLELGFFLKKIVFNLFGFYNL